MPIFVLKMPFSVEVLLDAGQCAAVWNNISYLNAGSQSQKSQLMINFFVLSSVYSENTGWYGGWTFLSYSSRGFERNFSPQRGLVLKGDHQLQNDEK